MVATEAEVGETGNSEQRRRRANRTRVLVGVYCVGTVNCVGTFVSRLSAVSGRLALVTHQRKFLHFERCWYRHGQPFSDLPPSCGPVNDD